MMKSTIKSNIGRRLLLLAAVSTMPVLIAMVVISWLAIDESQAQLSRENQSLAESTQNHLDYVLQQSLEQLNNIQFSPNVNMDDENIEPEKLALHSVYLSSIFDSVFLTDDAGILLWREPELRDSLGSDLKTCSPVSMALQTSRPIISNACYVSAIDDYAVFLISSLGNRAGGVAGLVGGYILLGGDNLSELLLPSDVGKTTYISIIDENGVVLATNYPGGPDKVGNIDQEGETETIPLDMVSWSVSVSQVKDQYLGPIRALETRFIIAGSISLVVVFFLSMGMAYSLVKPIGQLSDAAQRVAQGNLSEPMPPLGSDEIGELGKSFDSMRQELKSSLNEIQDWNRELEAKIEERTLQLRKSYNEIERNEVARRQLLQKVLMAQEEERKRVARELHDETTQSIIGLVMRLEAAHYASDDETGAGISKMLDDIKTLALSTLDSVHKVIYDLRPSVLDDLGLISALRWYAQNRLEEIGIKARIEITGDERELPPQVEIALFRVVQEAISNIVKHSKANIALITVEYREKSILIEVEDDGRGFDLVMIISQAGHGHGLGLMGMRERIELLGGRFHIESHPGKGTHITVEIPVESE